MAKEQIEILFCEYMCKNCETWIEKMHSIWIDIPHKLEAKCPRCGKEEIVLMQVERMYREEKEEDEL